MKTRAQTTIDDRLLRKKVGKNFSRILRERNHSTVHAALLLEMPKSRIEAIKSGNSLPTLLSLIRMAEDLECNLMEFLQ